jgi:aerobic-type carbon monoxide dehydrogenase small subunit (CoxS/CutS family)
MNRRIDITLTVNGERVARSVDTRLHLVDFLRTELGLTGSHTACEHGVCGACTVRVDGEPVRGCLVLAASLDGAVGRDHRGPLRQRRDPRPAGGLRRPQRRPVRLSARRACWSPPPTSSARRPMPRREEIREHISGNYCRCTGYQAIVDAVEDTLKARRTREAAR